MALGSDTDDMPSTTGSTIEPTVGSTIGASAIFEIAPISTIPTVGIDVAVALAEAVVESGHDHGFDIHAEALGLVVADARRRGLPSVLADVVVDPTAPTVARFRALGRLLQHWDGADEPGPTGSTRSPVAHLDAYPAAKASAAA